MVITDDARELHKNSLVMDIHCHPSLKVRLFDYKIYDHEHNFLIFPVDSSKKDEIFQMQYDLSDMIKGGVKAIWSSIYIVEHGLLDHSDPLKFGLWITKGLGFKFDKIIEDNSTPDKPYLQTMTVMELMEQQVKTARGKGFNVTYAKTFSEFENAINNGTACYIHSLEGAHMLGRKLPDTNSYLEKVQNLLAFGVCSMTLGHFMPNDVCYPVNGISPHTKESLGFNFDYSTYEMLGLTQEGKAIVDLMLDIGMIVDLNHVSPPGRKDVYEINEARGNGKLRPLVFSHIGIRRFCKNEIKTPEDWEIRKIRDSNGVIGIIFMNYWLRGFEGEPDYGLDNIVKTVVEIAKICSETESESYLNNLNFDHISIGSDMDGFTQPIDDLYNSSQMVRLTQALLNKGISQDNIKKILGGNAMRVLRLGWGK